MYHNLFNLSTIHRYVGFSKIIFWNANLCYREYLQAIIFVQMCKYFFKIDFRKWNSWVKKYMHFQFCEKLLSYSSTILPIYISTNSIRENRNFKNFSHKIIQGGKQPRCSCGLSDNPGEVLVQQRDGGGVRAHPWPTWACCGGAEVERSWKRAEETRKTEERKRNQVRKYYPAAEFGGDDG